jgi:DNA-binding protein H-NS
MADIDLNSLSRADLVKLRVDIERAIAGAADRERRAAREAAEAAAREHGFSLADLTSGLGASSARSKGRKSADGASGGAGASEAREVRFRNPEDHSQTWSGRGRRPAWYNEALAAGRVIEDLKAA